jgi:16S rRNA (guanine527-N7)-methyltransferase
MLEQYLELLLKWNDTHNLTSITDPQKIKTHHFEDSCAPLPFLEGKKRLVDLGTGAGFPGIPLKIANPELEITLIDAKRKKIAFCNEVIRKLKLDGIEAMQGRAEDPYVYRSLGVFDVVISRATWPLNVYLEMSDPYYDESGICIAMRGSKCKEELSEARDIMERHKLVLNDEHAYTIGDYEGRCLLIFKKKQF